MTSSLTAWAFVVLAIGGVIKAQEECRPRQEDLRRWDEVKVKTAVVKEENGFSYQVDVTLEGAGSFSGKFKECVNISMKLEDNTITRGAKRWNPPWSFRNKQKCQSYALSMEAIPTIPTRDFPDWYKPITKDITIPPDSRDVSFTVVPKTFTETEVKIDIQSVACKALLGDFYLNCPPIQELHGYASTDWKVRVKNIIPGRNVTCWATSSFRKADDILKDVVIHSKVPKWTVESHETHLFVNLNDGIFSEQTLLIKAATRISNIQSEPFTLTKEDRWLPEEYPPYTNVTVCILVTWRGCEKSPCEQSSLGCQTVETSQTKPGKQKPPQLARVTETSLSVQWNAPTDVNGRLNQIELLIVGYCLRTQVCPQSCKTETTNEIVTVSPNKYYYEFKDLKPYHNYWVSLRVVNDVAEGNWSEPLREMTPSSAEIDLIDINITALSARSVLIEVVPDCPFFGPLEVEYYREQNRYYPEERLGYDADHVLSPVQLGNFKPGSHARVCVSVQTPDRYGTRKEHCEPLQMPEERPGGPPEVRLVGQSLQPDGFRFNIIPPNEPNGVITNYPLVIQEKCPYSDPVCPDCSFWQDVGAHSLTSLSDWTYELTLLRPFTRYSVVARAVNSAGSSDFSQPLEVTTRPSLQNVKDIDFSASPGDNYIVVTLAHMCPYFGPFEANFEVRDSKEKMVDWKVLTYDLEKNSTSLSLKFERGLLTAQTYQVCLKDIRLVATTPPCLGDCGKAVSDCKTTMTTCYPIPAPTKSPYQVEWSANLEFDPYTEVMVRIPSGAFDGSHSGITSFQVQCQDESKCSSNQVGDANWERETSLKLSGLALNTQYSVFASAHGCKNNKASSGVIQVRTMKYSPPQLTLVEDKEVLNLYKRKCEGLCKIFKLTEILCSTRHVITTYEISNTNEVYSTPQLFGDSGSEICLESKIVGEFGECLLALDLKNDFDPVYITMRTNLEPGVKYDAFVSIKAGSNHLHIVLVSLLLIMLLAIVVLGLVLYYRWSGRGAKEAPAPRLSLPEAVPLTDRETQRPLALEELHNWVTSADFDVEAEYNRLGEVDQRLLWPQSCAQARRWNTEKMNRYGNTIPYDRSRVALRRLVGDCDYVNASWVRGHNFGGERDFIACQGPPRVTFPHFWTMIVENDVRLVVMLTKLREGGKQGQADDERHQVKCDKYWPNRGKVETYGDVTVKCVSETAHERVPNLTTRTFKATCGWSSSGGLTVTQLHFTGWPDHDVPEAPEALLRLLDVVRAARTKAGAVSPVAVHCSAGVGRTGTLIALDNVVSAIAGGSAIVDVFNTVFRLREDRKYMVQKPVQYRYLYECVATHVRERGLVVPRSDTDDDPYAYWAEQSDYTYTS